MADDLDTFRDQLRGWLAANAPIGPLPEEDNARAQAQIDWQRTLNRAGYSGLSLPTDVGGRGLSAIYDGVLNEELGAAGAPPILDSVYLAHVVILFADEAQRAGLIPRMISGEDRWCQGFSEPGAGSDLAALRTRATRDGDDWVINGQKIWTTSAEWATHCLVLARTDEDVPRHRGISAFVVPMGTPGLSSRPIPQSSGHVEFSEVFFDDVRVPHGALLGEPGDGWNVAMTTVTLERGPSDSGYAAKHLTLLSRLERVARDEEATDADRLMLARSYVDVEVLRIRVQESLLARADGHGAGPESSVDKLLMIATEQQLHHCALHMVGAQAVFPENPSWLNEYLHSRAVSIYGGTEQIQRGIIAQRVLGLPRG